MYITNAITNNLQVFDQRELFSNPLSFITPMDLVLFLLLFLCLNLLVKAIEGQDNHIAYMELIAEAEADADNIDDDLRNSRQEYLDDDYELYFSIPAIGQKNYEDLVACQAIKEDEFDYSYISDSELLTSVRIKG